jgi:hypothetical protein
MLTGAVVVTSQASDGLASSADMGSGRSSVDEQKRWLRVRSLVAKALHRLVTLAHASAPAPEAAPAQVLSLPPQYRVCAVIDATHTTHTRHGTHITRTIARAACATKGQGQGCRAAQAGCCRGPGGQARPPRQRRTNLPFPSERRLSIRPSTDFDTCAVSCVSCRVVCRAVSCRVVLCVVSCVDVNRGTRCGS